MTSDFRSGCMDSIWQVTLGKQDSFGHKSDATWLCLAQSVARWLLFFFFVLCVLLKRLLRQG